MTDLSIQFRDSFLERVPEPGGPAERIPLRQLPFTIGRSETAEQTIYSGKVSKEHASIVASDGRLVIRDLASTNGTFVNGQRITEHVLADGDIIHIAHVEFCFRRGSTMVRAATPALVSAIEQTEMVSTDHRDSLIAGTELLRDMLRREAVEIQYQPIVDLATREPVGYEALGRGAHPDLSSSPAVLLRLAEQCGLVVELSRLFAKRALEESVRLPAETRLFVNVHAHEIASDGLPAWLDAVRELAPPGRRIVLEIAEASVTDVAAMAALKQNFTRLELEFAYDDFGAGQARLLELIDVPPNYLKIDKTMIQGIDTAVSRQEMLRALLGVVTSLGAQVIAEGIETDVTARVCQELGCSLGQGFLFGPLV